MTLCPPVPLEIHQLSSLARQLPLLCVCEEQLRLKQYVANRNLKYVNNDDSRPENKTTDLKAVEQKTTAKVENKSYAGSWTLKEGVELNNYLYDNNTFQRLFLQQTVENRYETSLDLLAWGLYVSGDYAPTGSKFSTSAGIRFDGNNYSPKMLRLWNQASPRASMRYAFNPHWSLGLSAGWYSQLPPFSALGFKDTEGIYVNKELDYMHVAQSALGVEWRMNQNFSLSVAQLNSQLKLVELVEAM